MLDSSMSPRSRVAALVALLLSLGAHPGLAQPPTTSDRPGAVVPPPSVVIDAEEGLVLGRARDASTGVPVVGAEVLLVPTFVPGREHRATTDERGRYRLPEVTPGVYRLVGSAPGYLTPRSARTNLTIETTIDVRGGRATRGADVELIRPAAISGRIYDAAGNGLASAEVEVMAPPLPGGLPLPTASTITDDDGLYELHDLPPGTYTVRATPADPAHRPDPERMEILVPTFFPTGTRPLDAQPLRVAPGGQLTGIDFALTVSTTGSLGGLVVDVSGEPVAGASVRLLPTLAGPAPPARVASTGDDGTFVVRELVRQPYLLSVDRPSGSALRRLVAAEEMDTPLLLVFPPTAQLRVKVTTINGRNQPLVQRLSIMSHAIDEAGPESGVSGTRSMGVPEDGHITLNGLSVPALLHVQAPSGWSLNAIRRNGADVTYDRHHVTAATDEIEVVLTNETIAVGGVVDVDDETPPDATVVVFPAGLILRQQPDLIKSVRTNADGRFQVRGLPPADYLAIAMRQLPTNAWIMHNVLDRLEPDAVRFRLEPGQDAELTLPLASPPPGLSR